MFGLCFHPGMNLIRLPSKCPREADRRRERVVTFTHAVDGLDGHADAFGDLPATEYRLHPSDGLGPHSICNHFFRKGLGRKPGRVLPLLF